MSVSLSPEELVSLVRQVFEPRPDDGGLAVLVDLPDEFRPDRDDWRARRDLAEQWARMLHQRCRSLGLAEVLFCTYPNVGANNADLPSLVTVVSPGEATPLPLELSALFDRCRLAIAMTELSATAPLKVLARASGLRGVTMPGFSPAMVPALRLDYGQVNHRVWRLKELLDRAQGAELHFLLPDGEKHRLSLDLRFRQGHASGGLQREAGQVGNLPSGEAYIVPYEGERPDEASRSAGTLPVQFGSDIVVYRVEGNRAVEVVSDNEASHREAELLRQEPAYANLAELGLGVLGDLGVEPCGEVLLDEKLGLHVAFGRSEHFGGQVGPQHFSRPGAVVHIDRVYLPQTQPLVQVELVELRLEGSTVELMVDGQYRLELDS
jgi:hypothetical protein